MRLAQYCNECWGSPKQRRATQASNEASRGTYTIGWNFGDGLPIGNKHDAAVGQLEEMSNGDPRKGFVGLGLSCLWAAIYLRDSSEKRSARQVSGVTHRAMLSLELSLCVGTDK